MIYSEEFKEHVNGKIWACVNETTPPRLERFPVLYADDVCLLYDLDISECVSCRIIPFCVHLRNTRYDLISSD